MADVFQFLSSASLEKLTGRRAYNIDEMLEVIKTCPDSSIFYHTFSVFRKLREVQVPFNNDFAIWASRCLNEKALAEKLMAIDLAEYDTVKNLRKRLIEIIEDYRKQNPAVCQKRADEPFFLYDAIRIVYLTDKFAYDLKSFREVLETISVDSIYFHFIESRLDTHLLADDFSTWMEKGLNLSDLADRIRKIDISVYTLDALRSKIVQLIDGYINSSKVKRRGKR